MNALQLPRCAERPRTMGMSMTIKAFRTKQALTDWDSTTGLFLVSAAHYDDVDSIVSERVSWERRKQVTGGVVAL